MYTIKRKRYDVDFDISGEFLDVDIKFKYNSSFVYRHNLIHYLLDVFSERGIVKHSGEWLQDVLGDDVTYSTCFDIGEFAELTYDEAIRKFALDFARIP